MTGPTQANAAERKPRVFMFVMNELVHDARVLKTAGTAAATCDVLLGGLLRRKFDVDCAAERAKWPFAMDWVDLGRGGRLPRNMIGYALRWLIACVGLVRMGRRFRPDLVHAHELSGLPVGLLVARLCGARIIYDAHELYRDMTDGAPWYWRIIASWETRLMRGCDAIIACSAERAQIMRDEYGAPFLPVVVANMPPRRDYAPSRILWERTGAAAAGITRLVLYQGAIMIGRGLDHLPQVAALLPPHVGVVMVGGGDEAYRAELQARAAELGVADRFFMLPAVPQTELFAYTCSADVGVVIYRNTCRNNYYCAPNKLYEYCAAGLPMAGADLPPIRDFLASYGVGEVFDPEDAPSLAAAVERLLADDARYDEVRRNCLEAARTCNWETQPAPVLGRLYADLLDGKSQAG